MGKREQHELRYAAVLEAAMKLVRVLLITALSVPALPALAATDDDGLGFGHMLSLVQVLVRLAGQSDDPVAGLKAMDDVLAGRNLEANRAAAGLFNEMTAGMPAEHRDKMASIAGDVLGLARRDLGKAPAAGTISTETSLQARKDLTAMGLRYFDAKDYLEAVKRDDALAVELFIAGRGVNLGSRDADGRGAAEIARANGNARLAELLARNLPAAR
jgi:hypothetical protein